MLRMEGINHWLEVLKTKAPAGYAIALHIEFNAPKLLFQTYPVAWINKYEDNGFVMHDPTVQWGFTNAGVKRWSALASLDTKDVLIQARYFGLNFGFTVAINANAKHTIASFSRSDREFTDAEMSVISEILQGIHSEDISAITLSDKQKALLNALASGARVEAASNSLGISVVTVKSQLSAVRALLGVRTSAEAVQRAADLGLLK